MANKLFRKKRQQQYVVATNANHALQLANMDRSQFFSNYNQEGRTAAPVGVYTDAESLARAEVANVRR